MAHYAQKSISIEQQIALLKERGIGFINESKAYHLLTHISLFRMKSYLLPFMSDKVAQLYKKGSTFDAAYELYKFDSDLRKFVCSELEKIEVSIRTQISQIMSDKYGPFWFTNSKLFSDPDKHAKLQDSIANEVDRSDDDALKKFNAEYDDATPPSWIAMEVMSFGTLSMLYKQLKPIPEKRIIANVYGVADTVFESWLHSVVYIRNICAHHSRLWNKVMGIRPIYPKRTRKVFLNKCTSNNRLFYLLSIIKYMQNEVTPNNTLSDRLKSLLTQYPHVDISAMGFPANWQDELLWK